ncbi:hypothetical protein L249_6392 [Ophiocordyceps polyrhachis-furcata BCC 54312]|uniref:Uncharacterized protein n=1 Tax=Ophiocordyceps polyrhachis-furcata BCC 54312 TaxID=1330021 RepID=A0A367LK54_9HYPO|nr:hypothetical protein L249_6392 [Ophiocordyceps polyrhachis-furcata BCC 54312]
MKYFKVLDGLEKELVTVPLARALDGKDEVIPPPAQLDLALKLRVTQTLPVDGILHRIPDDGLELAGVVVFEANDALGETHCELDGVVAHDRPGDGDGGHEPVGGGRYGRELCVICANALVHVHRQTDGLARTKLGDENIRMNGTDGVVACKVLVLLTDRDEDYIPSVDVGVVIGSSRVRLARSGVFVDGAADIELELDGIPIEAGSVRIFTRLGLLVPKKIVVNTLTTAGEGDEAESMSQHLVLYDGSIVLDVDVFNRQRRYFGDEDSSEGVCERGVEADDSSALGRLAPCEGAILSGYGRKGGRMGVTT